MRPAPIRTARPGRGGAVGHLAAFDPRRKLPGDAAKRAAPAGDGPGRTVGLRACKNRSQGIFGPLAFAGWSDYIFAGRMPGLSDPHMARRISVPPGRCAGNTIRKNRYRPFFFQYSSTQRRYPSTGLPNLSSALLPSPFHSESSATLQPAAGTAPDHPARSGAPWATSPPSIRAGSCQVMRPGGPHRPAMVRAAPWHWCRSGAPFNGR